MRLWQVAEDLAVHAGSDAPGARAGILRATRDLSALCLRLMDASEETGEAEAAAPEPRPAGSEGTSTGTVAARLLGTLQLAIDGSPVDDWNGHKARSVVAFLLANARKPVPKDVLLDLLWPHAALDAGRRNLHQAIYSARRAIRRVRPDIDLVAFEDGCYRLTSGVVIWIDAQELEERVASGCRLEREGRAREAAEEYGVAHSLYRGDFLEDHLYDDWTRIPRDRLRAAHRHAAVRLCAHHTADGQLSAAVGVCHRLLSLDHCDEEIHRSLMRLYAAQGQRHLVLGQFEACTRALRTDLGLLPSEETAALCRDLAGCCSTPATRPTESTLRNA